MAERANNFLIKTVRGTRRQILAYDPDVFDQKIILSVSLILTDKAVDMSKTTEDIPNTEIGLYDISADTPNTDALDEYGATHYNTIHEEDVDADPKQTLEDLAIAIYPKPKSTKIIGSKRVEKGSQYAYNLDRFYDQNLDNDYEWSITGLASFEGNNINTKSVTLNFGDEDGKVTLMCKVTNPAGCFRYIIKNIYIGVVSKDLLVVRNTYF